MPGQAGLFRRIGWTWSTTARLKQVLASLLVTVLFVGIKLTAAKEIVQLIERCHSNGLKVIIDFVPNHVARSYDSDVMPQLSFGKDDRRKAKN